MDEDYDIWIYEPAYIHMSIIKKKINEKEQWMGYWDLDDPTGWSWYSDDGDFLLGLLRVMTCEECTEKSIRLLKEEAPINVFKHALKNSLKISEKTEWPDGLYAVLGDNAEIEFGVYSEDILAEIYDRIKESYPNATEDELNKIWGISYDEKEVIKLLKDGWYKEINAIIDSMLIDTYEDLFERIRAVFGEYREKAKEIIYDIITEKAEKIEKEICNKAQVKILN